MSNKIKLGYLAQTMVVIAIFLQPVTMQAQFAGGNGTAASPYQISTPAQLEYFARLINAKNTDYNDKHYILTANIDLSGYGANFNNGKGWIPIGTTYMNPFNGIFDGNGKKITGLYINSDSDLLGLFGYLMGTVKNLALEEVNVTGRNDVGSFAGMLYSGMIANSYVTGNIKGVDQVGGMVGYVCFSKIDNCYILGAVSGKIYIGGMIGCSINGQISNCFALNSSVEATDGTTVRRIVGYYGGSRTILNNLAFAGMKIIGEGILRGPSTDPFNFSDGTDCTVSEIATMKFSEIFKFEPPNNDPWTYEAGKLPGFGAAIDMPDYLIQQ